MANNSSTKSVTQADFLSLFRNIALERHRHDVFKDFVTTSAIAIHNAVVMNDKLEQEYLTIINTYNSQDIQKMCELLGILIMLLEPEPTDILGSLYMDLGLGSEQQGQYFTPAAVSELMAQIGYGDELQNLSKPFVTLQEPACGAGGMVLAFVKIMLSYQHNPAEKLWVSCTDVNRLAALMAYLQLSLWNIPAEILVGNSLTMKMQERWLTPAHHLNGWEFKLKYREQCQYSIEAINALCEEEPKPKQKPNTSKEQELIQPVETETEKPLNEVFKGEQVAFDFHL